VVSDVAHMLCDNCHQREATCHIDDLREGVVVRRRDLCRECYEASSPEAMEHEEELSDGRCKYCGAPAEVGWGTVIRGPDGTVDNASNFVCEECMRRKAEG